MRSLPRRAPTGHRHRFRPAALLLLSALLALACSDDTAPPALSSVGGAQQKSPTLEPCEDGEVRECSITISQENGILACYDGMQTCAEGVFGECTGGHEVRMPMPPLSLLKQLAVSTSAPCVDNACEPGCRYFDEDPPDIGIGGAPPDGMGGLPNFSIPVLDEPCVTGRDCQVNYRCVEPETDASCSHSKCAVGEALDGSCNDECVDRICAVDPDCCGDYWDAGCVAQVATVCDAVCDVVDCPHDGCSPGSPLARTCDPCIDTVCTTMPECCDTEWTSLCVDELQDVCGTPPDVPEPDGSSVCDYSAYGHSQVQVQGASVSDRAYLYGGWVGSPVNASMNTQFATIEGNVTASVSLNADYSYIDGQVVTGSASYTGFSSTVTGGTTDDLPPTPTLPTHTFTCPSTGPTPTSGSITAATPYGDVVVPDGSTLTLDPGTYTFNSLQIGSGGTGAILELPADGRVTINVCGRVDFRENSSMTGLVPATSMNLDIYAENAIAAWGNNQLYGFLYAAGNSAGPKPCSGWPVVCDMALLQEGYVFIGEDATVNGIVIAGQRVDMRPGGTIDARGMADQCKIVGHDPDIVIPPPACPVSLTPDVISETATCQHNDEGYQDSTCSGYDLALDIPCDDIVPVCNHGDTDFSGDVTVGYYDGADSILAVETPPVPDGTCTETLTIPAGECADLTCVWPAGVHSVVVDPDAALSECDGRRLDNWTVADGRVCVASNTNVVVERYEADCPADMAPAWGLLTWEATTPDDSTIEFAAATAETEAELAGAPFLPLGTASNVAPDTQSCSEFGPTPVCPVDVTGQLNLQGVHAPFLDLQITLTQSGGEPLLHDWQITYTCEVDQ